MISGILSFDHTPVEDYQSMKRQVTDWGLWVKKMREQKLGGWGKR